jgi:hypothetical protein
VYPSEVQAAGASFCDVLAAKVGSGFGDHFSVVRQDGGGKLEVLKYHQAYSEQTAAIAAELDKLAAAITSTTEAALKGYVAAAAQAFRDDNWEAADEAWVAMNARNSSWYLRIGPDEVYWEPCAVRAGFHVSFGKIDLGSLEWQAKLDPVKDDMEQALAKLAGPPYRARKVAFKLPDFMEVVFNAGDARAPSGATIGQSLPNWGKVKESGRGRTVVMTNLYTDDDSIAALRAQASSLLCKQTMETYSSERAPALFSIILHEAAHNLGPAGEYKVNGKTDEAALGGQLASLYEEMKAQTSALFFSEWLAERKIVPTELAVKAHTRDLTWAFGHISRGMYDGEGNFRPYSQLAMMQLGFLMKEKAVVWKASETAANGTDQGCFEIDQGKLGPAVTKMMTQVAQIKARYDKKKGEALRKEFVDSKGEYERARAVITERVLRTPKQSFVYSYRLQ